MVSVLLVDPAGAELPAWEPGAHLDLVLSSGVVRQYSLSGDPADTRTYRLGVQVGSGIHRELRVGSTLEVGGPRNHFRFTGAGRVRFVAGGIGITPLLPMLREARARGLDWHLTYGGRARASMAFLDELPAERVSVRPQDEFGLLDLAEAVGVPEPDTVVYACGPPPLLAALEEYCRDWPAGSLRVERFVAVPPPAAEGQFEVRAERSGVDVVVGDGESILDRLEQAGLELPFSCREGICGSCETPVLDGTPLHRDHVLSDDERTAGRTMLICVSRAKSRRLVLDL